MHGVPCSARGLQADSCWRTGSNGSMHSPTFSSLSAPPLAIKPPPRRAKATELTADTWPAPTPAWVCRCTTWAEGQLAVAVETVGLAAKGNHATEC